MTSPATTWPGLLRVSLALAMQMRSRELGTGRGRGSGPGEASVSPCSSASGVTPSLSLPSSLSLLGGSVRLCLCGVCGLVPGSHGRFQKLPAHPGTCRAGRLLNRRDPPWDALWFLASQSRFPGHWPGGTGIGAIGLQTPRAPTCGGRQTEERVALCLPPEGRRWSKGGGQVPVSPCIPPRGT